MELHPSDFFIVVVDNEASTRNFLVDSFKKWGFQVKSYPEGDSALEAMKKGELPHVLFADIQMPGLSGIGLSKRAKELSKEIEVVLMTATPSVDSALEALRLGVHDYLLKPFESLEDVRKVIFHVCERIYLRLYTDYLVSELKLKNEEIRGLSRMSDALTEVADVSRTIEIGCEFIARAFGGIDVAFLQFIPKDLSLMVAARFPQTLFAGAQSKMFLPKSVGPELASIVEYLKNIEADEAFHELLVSSSKMTPSEHGAPGAAKSGQVKIGMQWKAFPFITRGIPRGIFAIQVEEWDDEIQRPLALRYLQSLEKYFENAFLHMRVVEMSTRDGLTGLYNVRAFREKLGEEFHSAQRIEHPLSLLFFDVDHFKKYNDTYGHQAGDVVLKIFADLLRKNFRSTDFVARYGGEEFCVILPHTELESSMKKAESLRKAIESHTFPNGQTQPLGKVTVSIGVAEYPQHASTPEKLIQVADAALYQAKKVSRNAVVKAEKDPSHIPPFESKHVTVGRPQEG